MKHRRKHELDAQVARELGIPQKEVRDISRAFLSAIMETLAELEEVHLDGFGKLRMVVEKASKNIIVLAASNKKGKNGRIKLRVERKFRVHFAKADPFKQLLRLKHGPNAEKKS